MPGKTRSMCLAVLATAFVADQPVYAQAVIGGDWRADVDAFAGRLVEMGAAPGIGLAIVQDDWVLHARGFGLADMDSGRGSTRKRRSTSPRPPRRSRRRR